MAVQTVFGFGGSKYEQDSVVIEFPLVLGKLRYQQEYQMRTSISGKDKKRLLGWRPIIEVEIYNLKDGDGSKMASLIAMVSSGEAITVYPRFDSSVAEISHDCYCISDVDPQDIAQCEAGQTMLLTFRGIDRLSSIPTPLSNPGTYNIIAKDGATTYNIVDHQSNNIIAKQ